MMDLGPNPWPAMRTDGKENPMSPEFLGVFSDAALGEPSESTKDFLARMDEDLIQDGRRSQEVAA